MQPAERAFLALRNAKCALRRSRKRAGVGPLESACLYDETARQALWLESLGLYPEPMEQKKGRP